MFIPRRSGLNRALFTLFTAMHSGIHWAGFGLGDISPMCARERWSVDQSKPC